MIPKKWIFRGNLPTTANGKIDRKLLAEELAR
jgi:acyl-CoA synthetase (AMP-forming)/AMP-acid ligase II